MIHFTCMHGRQNTYVHLKQQSACAAIVLAPTDLSHTKPVLGCGIYPQANPQFFNFQSLGHYRKSMFFPRTVTTQPALHLLTKQIARQLARRL